MIYNDWHPYIHVYLSPLFAFSNVFKSVCFIIVPYYLDAYTKLLYFQNLNSKVLDIQKEGKCLCWNFCPLQERDVREGADMLMVKPGMAYLDIVRDTKNKVHTCLCLGQTKAFFQNGENVIAAVFSIDHIALSIMT